MSTQSRAMIDKFLTEASNMYVPEGYISELILPTISRKATSGKLGKYGNGHLRIVNTVTGGKNGYAMVDSITRSSDTYYMDTHALKDLVTEEDKDNVEKPFDAEEDVVIALTTHLWLGKEKSLADALTSTSIITNNTTLSGTNQWSDYTNSNPLGDLKTGRIAVRNACGFRPNKAVMDANVAETLKFHPQLLEKLGYKDNRPGGLTEQELAKVLEVKKVLVADVLYNSAKQGQTDVLAPVWGKHFVYIYAPDKAAVRQKSLGYCIQKAGRKPRQVFKSFPDEPVNSTKIMVLDTYDQLLSDVTCAYLIKDSIA